MPEHNGAAMKPNVPEDAAGMASPDGVAGGFVDVDGERYYVIRNVDKMPPFFVSVISSADHWLFVSSSGGLTAGRVSPETALFPYLPVDRIHESNPHTGCKTIVRVRLQDRQVTWEPFNREHEGRFATSRNLYKNVLGNKLCFEEVNHDLALAFRYTWATSEPHGLVRRCELQNLGDEPLPVEFVDGLQNILPAGTPSLVQTNSSNLVDAYKWTELDSGTGLGVYALYSGISDRAEPSESLRANVVYGLGLDAPTVLLSSLQLDDFRQGKPVVQEDRKRGIRGAYFLVASLVLPSRASQRWQIVADIGQTQVQVTEIIRRLAAPADAARAVAQSVAAGCDKLARIVAAADGFQSTAEEPGTAHHYANVLFNVLRGGIFHDQYRVSAADFAKSVRQSSARVYELHRGLLDGLHETLAMQDLLSAVQRTGDPQLERLCYEYLPITFGRRHGDPSRPWNKFAIKLKDARGEPLLSYEGNWRDIFQNWEALTFSFPEFIEHVVAKFVNASTVDGYNPYRITREGIDWEVEEPGNPWSHIGYWGDHQIIYLLKFLEQSRQFHPARLSALLHRPIFSYANVPYRIKSFAELVADPKSTVDYDHALAARIADRVAAIGADGKLVLERGGSVYQVNLLEKLLVPLLAKLGNLVVDGGIWLNTQRPEWNDANDALVGHGVSMVTLYYMRRYVRFLQQLLAGEPGPVEYQQKSASGSPTRPRRSPASARSWATARSTLACAGTRCRSWAGRRAATGCRCTATIPFPAGWNDRSGRSWTCWPTRSRRSTTASAAIAARMASTTRTTCWTSSRTPSASTRCISCSRGRSPPSAPARSLRPQPQRWLNHCSAATFTGRINDPSCCIPTGRCQAFSRRTASLPTVSRHLPCCGA